MAGQQFVSADPRAAAWLTGTSQDGTITLGYGYARGWQWRTLIDTTDPARLAIRMDDVVPASAAARATRPATTGR